MARSNNFPVEIIFDKKAREKLIKGMNIVADAVGATLGPKGRNVAINKAYGAPDIIHDGVSVAKRIDLLDHFQDMGAQLLKEAAIQTNNEAGDGTTTATILAQAIVNKGFENIQAGANPMTLKQELEEARDLVIKELKKLSREIKEDEEVEMVATISSASTEIGKIVAEAIKKTGKDGIITIEEGKGVKTEIEYKEGLEFDRGYSSSYFVTDGERAESVIEDPYILLTDIKINTQNQLVPFLEMLSKNGIKNIVIIGEVLEEAQAVMVINKIRGAFNSLAVQAPAFGERQTDELEDIAAFTGGKVISQASGRQLDSVVIEELGRADKIISDRDKTKILGGKGDKGTLAKRIKDLEEQIKIANTEYDEGIKRDRLAKLTNKAATIKVGAVTDVELSDKKERTIDAKNAAKSSIEEGIVAGGQVTLMTISQMNFWPNTPGAKILREAIKKPFRILMENAGYDYAEALGKITPIKYPMAIDVMDGEVKNMIEAGIMDPTKVERSAIEKAVSVATMALTTSVAISEPYQNKEIK